MKPEETSHWPAEGQFWASMRPLALLRMGKCLPEDTGCAHRWTPDHDEEDMCFVFPLAPADYRYLWFEMRSSYAAALGFVPGDVWVYVNHPTTEQRLFFVGPETTPTEAVLHADHKLNFSLPQDPPKTSRAPLGNIITLNVVGAPLELALYQPGHRRKVPPAKTAWEHVNRDD